jgi:hypothetical protein
MCQTWSTLQGTRQTHPTSPLCITDIRSNVKHTAIFTLPNRVNNAALFIKESQTDTQTDTESAPAGPRSTWCINRFDLITVSSSQFWV